MPFDVPDDQPTGKEIYPAELDRLVQESCRRFEARFSGPLAITARAGGWFDDYRNEITSVIRLGYTLGQRDRARETKTAEGAQQAFRYPD